MISLGLGLPSRKQLPLPHWVTSPAEFAIDFVNDRAFFERQEYLSLSSVLASSSASFARASSGTYQATNGDFSEFLSGALRVGDRGALIEPSATNLHDYAAGSTNWDAQSASLTVAGLVDELGLFDGVEIASQGAAFHFSAAGQVALTSGAEYTVTMIYKQGTNTRIRLFIFDGTLGMVWRYIGIPGALVQENTDHVSAISLQEEEIEPGVFRAVVTFTTSDTVFAGLVSLGPDSSTAGVNVIGLAGQTEAGGTATSLTLSDGTPATRAADALTLSPAPGTYDITVTFDDDSTQLIADEVIGGGGWVVPTNLSRPYIKSITGALS